MSELPNPFKVVFNTSTPVKAVPVIQGASGAGAARYTHTQVSPSLSWVVNHNLGFIPTAVTVLSTGNVEVDANVTHSSINQLTVSFTVPYAGYVKII